MAHMKPIQQHIFLRSFRAAMEAIAEGLYTSRDTSTNNHWTIWSYFCANVVLKPLLLSYKYPIPFLSTFAAEYRSGNIGASGKNICSCTLEEAIRSIGQALAVMEAKDPRLNSEGGLDICLKFQYRVYYKQDPYLNRVKPVPVQVLLHIASIKSASTDEDLK